MDLLVRGCWLLWVAAAASARGEPGGSKSRSCAEVRQVYGAKGFSLSGVPQAEISGEHLRICPQGYTCCTSEMEENFANRSRSELEGALRETSRSMQVMLSTQLRNFDSHFQDLLNKSERALQDTFPGVHGDLYTQNARLFRDLYSELRRYYRGANINLEEALAEFWARLLERLFKQLHPQYVLPDEYLDCMGKQAEAYRPFGEAPRELKLRATRAFVAVRSFVQGLGVAIDVVRKVSQVLTKPPFSPAVEARRVAPEGFSTRPANGGRQGLLDLLDQNYGKMQDFPNVPLGQECSRAIMKLLYCSHCLGVQSPQPCSGYCRNVMKGCLANQADLDTEWKNLLESMLLVADKFDGQTSVESTIGTIHVRISEAIAALQDNKDTLTAKVFQGCGNPRVSGKGSGGEEKRRRGKSVAEERPSGIGLEKLVSEAKAQLRDVRDFWVSLPRVLCTEKVAMSSTLDERCWNGMTKGRYLPEVMGDGLASQINNPEVEVDITKPDMTIRQQIMQLKIMTNRLRNAYNGNDIDFQDTSDDISGSGSGDGCLDEVCGKRLSKSQSTRQPETHAIPNLSEHDGSGAPGCPQPSSLLLLLPLALAATWSLGR